MKKPFAIAKNPLAIGIAASMLTGLTAIITWFLRGGPQLPSGTDEIIKQVAQSDLSHVVSGETGYVTSHGVRIWYESIPANNVKSGASVKGTVLLSFGMGGDALFWPQSFIRALTSSGYRVIRYDQRGTGNSDWIRDWSWKQPYTLTDMAADALVVLDELRVEKAHVVGLSLGGFVSQEVAIAYPERVASLTLMSTTADPGDPALPAMRTADLLRRSLAELPIARYRLLGGEVNLVKERLAKTISRNGDKDLEVEDVAASVLYDLRFRHGINLRAPLQHLVAVWSTRSRYELLTGLEVPTLIIHGTDDSVVPIEHADKLAELIPGARQLRLNGVGHECPYPGMDAVAREIIAHLERS